MLIRDVVHFFPPNRKIDGRGAKDINSLIFLFKNILTMIRVGGGGGGLERIFTYFRRGGLRESSCKTFFGKILGVPRKVIFSVKVYLHLRERGEGRKAII